MEYIPRRKRFVFVLNYLLYDYSFFLISYCKSACMLPVSAQRYGNSQIYSELKAIPQPRLPPSGIWLSFSNLDELAESRSRALYPFCLASKDLLASVVLKYIFSGGG